jgi:hypothetical protein
LAVIGSWRSSEFWDLGRSFFPFRFPPFHFRPFLFFSLSLSLSLFTSKKLPGQDVWSTEMEGHEKTNWRDEILALMQDFEDRTPGSTTKEKESSLEWHYRDSEKFFGAWQVQHHAPTG